MCGRRDGCENPRKTQGDEGGDELVRSIRASVLAADGAVPSDYVGRPRRRRATALGVHGLYLVAACRLPLRLKFYST